ncbi:hypothetical protein D7V97_29495 [Corallococcus sp. CA053C]|nr:hypothetical protein D7V97_29495 [Corallococcus sp. CA053C]
MQEEDQRIALWKSDGTPGGTVALLTLPAPDMGERRIQNLTAVGSRLFFETRCRPSGPSRCGPCRPR